MGFDSEIQSLSTASNYDDEEKKVSGGRNDFGVKLANVYNSEFILETVSNGKKYLQTFRNNMIVIEQPILTACSEYACDYTWIIFRPDLQKFKMTRFDDDIFSLLAYDLAGDKCDDRWEMAFLPLILTSI
ncbi:11448_t:CDS:2, partial [Funneliformis mosseae]